MLNPIQVQPGHTPLVHALHALLYTHLQIRKPCKPNAASSKTREQQKRKDRRSSANLLCLVALARC